MVTASQSVYRVAVEKDVPMPTRDGVTLYSDVYRPDAPGPFPVLVVRTQTSRAALLLLAAASVGFTALTYVGPYVP